MCTIRRAMVQLLFSGFADFARVDASGLLVATCGFLARNDRGQARFQPMPCPRGLSLAMRMDTSIDVAKCGAPPIHVYGPISQAWPFGPAFSLELIAMFQSNGLPIVKPQVGFTLLDLDLVMLMEWLMLSSLNNSSREHALAIYSLWRRGGVPRRPP